MKLCKDCKYLYVSRLYGIHYCDRLIATGEDDLIRGPRYQTLHNECTFERLPSNKYYRACGPYAIYWEPNLKYRIINIFKKNEDSTIK